jgi:FkbM family methyltransferase
MAQPKENLAFRSFTYLQRSLRGTGLGRIRLLQRVRDGIYNLLRPSGLTQVSVEGFLLYIDPRDESVSKILLLDGTYEPTETRLIRSQLTEGSVFVDIGANIGYYTLLAASCVGHRGKVYSFEPEPNNFSLLSRNVEAYPTNNITVIQMAVSRESGTMSLYVEDAIAGGHTLFPSQEKQRTVTVKTTSLDDFFGEHIPEVTLMKMDIEGWEMEALQGMKKTINANPYIKLITEIFPKRLEECGSSPRGYLEELRQLSYRLHIIDEERGEVRIADDEEILTTAQRFGTTNLFCER